MIQVKGLDDLEDTNVLDAKVLSGALKVNDWETVYAVMKEASDTMGIDDCREDVCATTFEAMIRVLHLALPKIDDPPRDLFDAITETFRALRNSCVERSHNQNVIVRETSALIAAHSILTKLITLPPEKRVVSSIQVGVQFFGNTIVNNTENQKFVWTKCSTVLLELLKYNDEKVANYTSMILYNILLGCPELSLELGTQLLEALIDQAMLDSEFGMFAVELLLGRENFLESVYRNLKNEHKLFLLDVMHSMISTIEEKLPPRTVPLNSLLFLVRMFKDRSDCILSAVEKQVDEMEPREVAKLLEIIASAAYNKLYMDKLQEDDSLLISCSYLLKSIHALGKTGDNSFTAVQKLADLSAKGASKDIQQHPAFGFKASLIQLLGNLCWRNEANQNKIRELECIPLLLDCCNIDARNPLIIQWVVLAVRNACDHNLVNQELIGSLTQQGAVDTESLNKLGYQLHHDGDKPIRIVPLKR